jgi:hypothetical protein
MTIGWCWLSLGAPYNNHSAYEIVTVIAPELISQNVVMDANALAILNSWKALISNNADSLHREDL